MRARGRIISKASRVCLVCCVLAASASALLAEPKTVRAKTRATATESQDKTPKIEDIIKRVPPEYPYEARRNYHQGTGRYRVFVDLKTGVVTNVAILKSTGWPTLDSAAIRALRQWRLRPGKWKQFDFPVTYTMSRSRAEAMEKIRRIQAAEKR
jgi:periplasmic protein TonB